MTDLIGRTLGKYQIVVRVGVGGMARVYKAYQANLDRYVALKVLHSHLAEETDFVERFEREATAVARLRYPGIVQVYDYDIQDDLYYIVMEFIDGPTLKAEINERQKRNGDSEESIFTFEEVSHLLTALAGAIDYAHSRGMIHRDLKPGNIMFTADGEVLLTDFGLARITYASRHTQTGVLSGTPSYMAPEQVQGGRVDARTDVYSLGVVAYELLTGQVPFTADTSYAIMTKHVTDVVPPMAPLNSEIGAELEAAVLKALSKDPLLRYGSAGDFAAAVRTLAGLPSSSRFESTQFSAVATLADSQELVPTSSQVDPPTSSYSRITSPYRGLYAFREEDAPYFFGREAFTDRLLQTLGDKLMAAVIGPSGSGKSSVVFAGLLPQLRDQSNLSVMEMRPGGQPFNSLADALLAQLEPDVSDSARLIEINQLAKELREGRVKLSDVMSRINQSNGNDQYQVLVVDQFEELYTLCTDDEVRHTFPNTLFDAVYAGRVQDEADLRLVLTLRADFMGQALTDRPFADALQESDVKLGPMTRAELARAIESPAAKKNVVYEAGLVDRILDDVGDEPGNLPLLEFALTLLWERRTGRRLTHAAYENIGRVEGSLARYADEIYEELSYEERRLARRVFTQMVRPGEGTEDTRRLATRGELGYEEWELAQRLADARLVVTGRTADGQKTVEVVHEALIRGWGRLREWMNSERTFRGWQERLRAALRQWESTDRDSGALLRGVPLGEAEEWLASKSRDISAGEKAYIQASIALRERQAAEREAQRKRELEGARKLAEEQRLRAESERKRADDQAQATKRMRALAAVLAVIFLLAVAAAIFAVIQSQDAAMQADARATEVVIRSLAEADAMENAALAATRAAESAKARDAAESERERANEAALSALQARDEAEDERDRADDQAKLALSRQLAAQSATLLGPQLDLALLLSLEANHINNSAETASGILTALQSNPSLYTYLREHPSLLQSVDFNSDGELLVTAGSEGLVLIWDVASGEVIRQFSGHDPSQLVNRAHFSPDGTKVATASDDTSIILWDVASGRQLEVLGEHTAWVQSVEFSSDGERLISGSGDRTAIVWNATSGDPVQILSGHNGPLWDATLSHDGQRAATASNDGTVIVWELATGQPIYTLNGHNGVVFNTDFSPDDQLLASSGGDNNILLWDMTTGERIGDPIVGHGAGAVSVEFSPDGGQLVSSSADSTVRVWDVDSGQQLMVFGNHSGLVPLAAFGPEGRLLASGDATGVAIVWDLSQATQPLGTVLAAQPAGVNKVSFDPSGRLLASAAADGAIRLWDVAEGVQASDTVTHALRFDEPISAVDYDESGEVLASGSENGTVMVWEVAGGEPLTNSLSVAANGVTSLDLGDDSRTLVVGGHTGFVTVWDIILGQLTGVALSGHSGPVGAVAVSPDLSTVASGGSDGSVIIRPMAEIASGQGPGTVLTYTGQAGSSITSMSFGPDSRQLVSGDDRGNVVLWDASAGQLQSVIVSLANGITDLEFNPEGTLLAVGDEGGNIRLWDTRDWSLTAGRLRGFQSGVGALTFDRSGQSLVAIARDGVWRSWTLADRAISEEGTNESIDDSDIVTLNPDLRFAIGGTEGTLVESALSEAEQDVNRMQHSAPMLAAVSSIAYSPDGRTIASSGFDGAIVIWDAATLEPVGQPLIGHTAGAVNLVFSPDGRELASGSCAGFHERGSCIQGEVIIWNLDTREQVRVINDTVGFSQALAYSPNGQLLSVNDCLRVEVAGVCVEANVRLFDVATGELVQELPGHSAFVWSAAFSPDGTLLATGSNDNTIILWDVERGEPVGSTLSNHGGPVRRVSFSPDGTRLASAGFDNVVILWDVASGQAIGGPLAVYTNNAMDAVFSPDGKLVASSSLDGNVTLSDVSLESWRERACRVANRNLREEEWILFFGESPARVICQ